MLVTEMVPGPRPLPLGATPTSTSTASRCSAFTKQKLRQYPVRFGGGCYHVMDWDPEVAELGLRFCQGVGLRGLLNVEFKRDERDGELKLIECNHRFTAPNEQLRIAGIDVALLVYNRILGRPLPAVGEPRAGVRLWHPGQDFRSFLELRRRGDLTTAGWLRSVARPQHLPLFRWDDPQPSLALQATRARRVWDKRLGRSAGATPSLDAGPVRANRAEEALAAVASGGHGR